MIHTYNSHSEKDTKQIGKKIALAIKDAYKGGNKSLLLCLNGDLGAGKTAFAKGFLSAFGIKKVVSPTFVIMKKYGVRHPFIKNIYHFDCYRLLSEEDLVVLGIEEIINNPQNVILMEWSEKAGKYGKGLSLDFHLGDGVLDRQIIIQDKYLSSLL